jgi:hypothetical protein
MHGSSGTPRCADFDRRLTSGRFGEGRMSFFSRLFGSKPPPEAKPERGAVLLAWTGSYDMRIPGKPEHQRDREKAFDEFTRGGAEAFCSVILYPEPGGAVACEIDDRIVGYLGESEAAEFRERMRAMGHDDETGGLCMAMIANDGFMPGERFVLLLDLEWPIEEQKGEPAGGIHKLVS